jgi:hypothetical protein
MCAGDQELRARLEADYRAARPGGKPHQTTFDALLVCVRWLEACYRHDGPTVQRTWPQIARAWRRLGLPLEISGTAKRDHQRHRNNLARRLDYLVEMGWVQAWEPVYEPSGESTGIVVRIGADVAQLARAPLS